MPLALGVAHLLHDHLLGGLGGDARKIHRRQCFCDDVADLRGRVAGARILQRNLDLVVIDHLDDVQITRDMRLAGLRIDVDANFVLAPVAGFRGALHRLFHRMQHDRFVDRLVARDGVGNLQKFCSVGGNGSHVVRLLLKPALCGLSNPLESMRHVSIRRAWPRR